MIENMREFNQTLKINKVFIIQRDLVDLIEVLDLRLRRLEDHLGIPVPDDLKPIRERLK